MSHPRFRGLAALLLGFALAAPAALAQDGATVPGADRIEVAGRGTVHGEPDVARLQLGVDRADADVDAALTAANEAMEALRATLTRHGVAERDVRTDVFDVRQETHRDREGRVEDTTYRVIHLLAVRVDDLGTLGGLLTDAVEAGADRVGQVRFELADPSALEDEARSLAMEDARRKAQRLADAAERSLGPVRVIRERGGAGLRDDAPTMELLDARAVGGDVPVTGGSLAVAVQLEVTFGLE